VTAETESVKWTSAFLKSQKPIAKNLITRATYKK